MQNQWFLIILLTSFFTRRAIERAFFLAQTRLPPACRMSGMDGGQA
jgi:hypothetical protein